jgi:hypothetical protein
MKTIFTLLASLIMSMAVFAADVKPKSMLTVKSNDQGDIRVVLDGRRFESADNSLVIRQLQSGYHQIKVYRAKSNGYFNIFGHQYEMVYSTSLMVKPRTHVKITIDRFGRTIVNERRIRGNSYGRDWDENRNGRDNGLENDHDYDFDHGGQQGDYDNNYGYERGMDSREFSQVLQSINKEWLESNKLKSAIQIVKTNSLTSAQVKEMILLFSFENNKLELAKQAYANTVDKRNYHMINDVFSFSNSKDELARYIRNH